VAWVELGALSAPVGAGLRSPWPEVFEVASCAKITYSNGLRTSPRRVSPLAKRTEDGVAA
jgi:hypothetical protein